MVYARGPDVSSHQGVIDWGKVAAGWEFAVARMTIGRSTLDDRGVANLKEMGATGIIPGAYGVVGYAEPVEDGAELLVRQIRAAGADPARILVMLDAEDFSDGSHPTIGQVDRYAGRLRALIGRWPVAYVPLWWLGKHAYTVDGLALSNCPWAQSHYYDPWYWSDTELFFRQPDLTHGWKQLAWLQYTDAATVAGISGGVDANVFYGTAAELRTQLLGQPTGDDMSAEDVTAINAHTDQKFAALTKALTVDGTTGLADSVEKLYGHAKGADGYAKAAAVNTATILDALGTVQTKLDAGLTAGLTPEQIADIKADLKAALPTLEGSALVSLVVSPPK